MPREAIENTNVHLEKDCISSKKKVQRGGREQGCGGGKINNRLFSSSSASPSLLSSSLSSAFTRYPDTFKLAVAAEISGFEASDKDGDRVDSEVVTASEEVVIVSEEVGQDNEEEEE